MEKIVVLTDLHLRAQGKTIIGLDTVARFQAVYRSICAQHSDARALILMGDLTHSGHADEYRILRDLLADCPIPVTFMMGNHDVRGAFDATFGDVPRTPHGHVQRVIDLDHHRIITLDTLQPDATPHHAGTLCAHRLAWLDGALEGAGARMPLVFAHHPPHAVGLPGMDAIALTNGNALLDRLRGAGAHLFCGHVHRTISGQAAGVPFTMFKSPCHQAPLDLINADSTLSIDEPGAYGVVLLTDGGVIAHTQDVGLSSTVYTGADALPEPEQTP